MTDFQEDKEFDALVASIHAEIDASPALSSCKSFSELHDHCDANCLGEQETFFETHGMLDGRLELAQQCVDQILKARNA